MSESSMWIIPEAPAPEAVRTAAPSPRSASGAPLRLGILNNSKSNADRLLPMIVEGIKAEVAIASVVSLRKPGPAAGATPDVLDRLTKEADCVISAMAD